MIKKFLITLPVLAATASPVYAQQFTEAELRKHDMDRPRCSATITDNCRSWGPASDAPPTVTEDTTRSENSAVAAGTSAAVYRDGTRNRQNLRPDEDAADQERAAQGTNDNGTIDWDGDPKTPR